MAEVSAEFVGEPLRYELDGVSDDLLTAGLGLTGLRGPPPPFAVAAHPTPRELRRRAIYQAYRALVDTSDAGGFGRLYGPVGDARIAGVEILTAVRTPTGAGTTSVLLQVPRSFDPARPRLLAVASSGSRGIYGALPTAAEWGLRHGFAVVHSDKGTGVGVWDVDRRRGYRIDGTLSDDPDDALQSFVPRLGPELAALAAAEPGTLLMKHAQSGENPESAWGVYLLQAIAAAWVLLNGEFAGVRPRRYGPDNTLVLAAGISNGGAAVLRALERDRAGWISGAVACEPSVVVPGRAGGAAIACGGRRLAVADLVADDYIGLHYLLQPAAVLADADPGAPFREATAARRGALESWCRALQDSGVLPAGTVAGAAAAARARLIAAGILPAALALGHFNLAVSLWPSIATAYAWAYARRPPWDAGGGASFAATDAAGEVRALGDEEAAALWADGSGIAPGAGISLVARQADGRRRAVNDGTLEQALAAAPAALLARVPAGSLPPGRDALQAGVRRGREEVVMSARLGNRPVIIVHGRADGLIPVNHASRAYYAVNQEERGARDELHYYELEHGQHFDNALLLPAAAAAFVPMQPWLGHLLDALLSRLTDGASLPPSQVIRSRARGLVAGVVPPLAPGHLGTLRAEPAADRIRFAAGVLAVPD
jgi:hydroxybutyrate-dimer hydrolase